MNELKDKHTEDYLNSDEVKFREWVVELYNSFLPQITYYDEEFNENYTYAEGGIHDGEWELYVWDDEPSSRIIEFLDILHNEMINDNEEE